MLVITGKQVSFFGYANCASLQTSLRNSGTTAERRCNYLLLVLGHVYANSLRLRSFEEQNWLFSISRRHSDDALGDIIKIELQ